MKFFKSQSAVRFIIAASIPLALAASAGSATAQPGRQRQQQQQQIRIQLFQWQGQVDREIRIQFDNRQASMIEAGSNERTRRRVNVTASLPNRPGTVSVQVLQGRGSVDVIQQPNARNRYTAIIRLRDPASGAARYRIAAFWEGDRNNRDNERRRN